MTLPPAETLQADDYELVDFAPEPKRTRNRIAAVMAAGLLVAVAAGVCAASPAIRNFFAS
jgi:hypothetical protein